MNSKDAELLRRILSGDITNQTDSSLTDEERERIERFGELGYLRTWIDGEFEILVDAYDALDNFDRARSESEQQARERAEQIAENQSEKQRVSREHRMDVRRDYVLFFLGLLLGWVLGQITPADAWTWIHALFGN